MPVTPQSPAAALFGYEVSDPETKMKSMLGQMTSALRSNGVAVAAPTSAIIGETPIATNLRWIKLLQSAMETGSHATAIMPSSTGNGIKLTAKLAGAPGALVSFKVESGTMSGAKITITDGSTPEVYDNVATSPLSGVVTAMVGSLLVDAAVVGTGDIIVAGPTSLVVGVPFTAPVFAQGENDNQEVLASKWARALWDGLVAAGYLK